MESIEYINSKLDKLDTVFAKAVSSLKRDRKFKKIDLSKGSVHIAVNSIMDALSPTAELKELIIHYQKTKNSQKTRSVYIDGFEVCFVPRELDSVGYVINRKDAKETIRGWKVPENYQYAVDIMIKDAGLAETDSSPIITSLA